MSTNDPAVSVVVPVRNEAGNIGALVAEIATALSDRWPFEVIYVDDGSSDGTAAELDRLKSQHAWLRRLRHRQSCGQSVAVCSGVAAARAPVVVTLDGDGQNDPAFIPALVRTRDSMRSRAMDMLVTVKDLDEVISEALWSPTLFDTDAKAS
jgi:glycosyltransferase involved in cell wall biosynthesis